MNRNTDLLVRCHRYLGLIRSRTFSACHDGAYYDSQSARWITPHDPSYFRLTIDATNNPTMKTLQSQKDIRGQFNFLSKRYSQFLLPISCDLIQMNESIFDLNHNNSSAKNDTFAILSSTNNEKRIKIPMNTMININIRSDDNHSIDESKKHVAEHFQIGNRIRCSMTNFDSMAPWEIGCIAAELCDAGCEEIFLDNRSQDDCRMDIDDLIQVMEEICYIVSFSKDLFLFGYILDWRLARTQRYSLSYIQ